MFKNKTLKRTIYIFLLIFIFLGINVLASSPDTFFDYTQMPGRDASVAILDNSIENIWSYLSLALRIAAVVAFIFAGVRYMFASADSKADIKKSMLVLILGSIIVFTSSIVIDFSIKVFNELTGEVAGGEEEKADADDADDDFGTLLAVGDTIDDASESVDEAIENYNLKYNNFVNLSGENLTKEQQEQLLEKISDSTKELKSTITELKQCASKLRKKLKSSYTYLDQAQETLKTAQEQAAEINENIKSASSKIKKLEVAEDDKITEKYYAEPKKKHDELIELVKSAITFLNSAKEALQIQIKNDNAEG